MDNKDYIKSRGRGPARGDESLQYVPPRPEKAELVARIDRLRQELKARPEPSIVRVPGQRYLPGGFRPHSPRWMIKELSDGSRVFMVVK